MKKLSVIIPAFCLLASALCFCPSTFAQNKSGGGKARKAGATAKIPGTDLENSLPSNFHHLALGDKAPDFSLPGTDGKTHTLADFASYPILMVVFLSNHCPYSHAAEARLIPFADEYKSRGVAVVAINPNNPDAVRLDELGYSKYNDSLADSKLYAKEAGFTFPYLYDGDTQTTAAAYGCLATPHVFIFDQDRRLRYVGRFDDSRFIEADTVHSNDARNAVDELLAGKPITTPTTRVMGCSTKWLSKTADVAKENEDWNHTPVTLEPIDDTAIAALVKNGTERTRLINVWATWCAPCVKEFPSFVKYSRQFSNRDFEFISISVDDLKNQPAVLKFLQDRHAGMSSRLTRILKKENRATTNYLYTGANTDALAKSLDPAWDGPVPYTILVSPDGKILYRQSGEIDIPALSQKLYETLGSGYNPRSSTGR